VIIEPRFNGPTESGNGGYTCGLVARALAPAAGFAAQVTLRHPPPLGTPLTVTRHGDELTVHHADTVIAEARSVRFDDPPVPAVPYETAEKVSQTYPGFTDHPFPQCYVCGPRRPNDDGLDIFPGLMSDGRTAAPWRVPETVDDITVWAALDCPGGWAIIGREVPTDGRPRPYVLGRMTASVRSVPAPGAQCVVTGEVVSVAGRKAEVRSAVYLAGQNEPLAHARATWIAI